MPFKLSDAPKDFEVTLNYPYLEEPIIHYYRRLSKEESRDLDAFGKKGEEREKATFRLFSKAILPKTKAEYDGLGENWKQELWDDEEGRKHIMHSTHMYLSVQVPSDFLSLLQRS